MQCEMAHFFVPLGEMSARHLCSIVPVVAIRHTHIILQYGKQLFKSRNDRFQLWHTFDMLWTIDSPPNREEFSNSDWHLRDEWCQMNEKSKTKNKRNLSNNLQVFKCSSAKDLCDDAQDRWHSLCWKYFMWHPNSVTRLWEDFYIILKFVHVFPNFKLWNTMNLNRPLIRLNFYVYFFCSLTSFFHRLFFSFHLCTSLSFITKKQQQKKHHHCLCVCSFSPFDHNNKAKSQNAHSHNETRCWVEEEEEAV